MTDREKHLHFVRLAEEAARYDEMVQGMKQVIELDAKLNENERKLLAVTYRKSVSGQRFAWRVIASVLARGKGTKRQLEMVKELRNKLEREVEEKCREILVSGWDLLDRVLIKEAADDEVKVFYLKLKADHFRYLAETRAVKNGVAEKAKQAYQEAFDLAKNKLRPMHPIRLTVALNFAILQFEVQKSPADACQTAQRAYDEATSDAQTTGDSICAESVTIMELLQDNISYWSGNTSKTE
ncbi:hypothetical protein niasHT_012978 [Heterodera trifolii]|uniref:14-3-3 domain-containing protein n=1 Tax=Heterodera trifolii TaxID=157864 RepID=A0ABD2L3J7_9BILA